MIVSPSEARTKKICVHTDDGGCVGDDCMAWRWVPNVGDIRVVPSPGGPYIVREEAPPTHGYCGLAGRP